MPAHERDSRTDKDHRSEVRRQATDERNDQRPPVLLAPPPAGFRGGCCRSVRVSLSSLMAARVRRKPAGRAVPFPESGSLGSNYET